jgi:uncharacterized protein (TIGR02996 family)
MRTFEHRQGTAHRFWNIEVQGNAHVVTFGKVGGKGQTQRKQFPGPAQARAAAKKLIREKVAKGYCETTARAAPASVSVPPLAQAMEAAIIDHPEEVANYAAYADYLQEQGDPRGEFIQVQLALEDPNRKASERKKLQQREQELLFAHEQEWVGDWAALTETTGGGRYGEDFTTPKAGFLRGILAQVTIDELTVACARAFVASPQTRLVRELRIGLWDYEQAGEYESDPGIPAKTYTPSQYVFLRWPYLSNLRVFQLGWPAAEEYATYYPGNCYTNGQLAHDFVKQMPRLEELYLLAKYVDGTKLFALPLPNLRVAQLYHSSDYGLTRLARNASLTKLTHLLCHPHALDGGGESYIRLADLRAVVRSPHLTSLKHLRLRLADFGDVGCQEIVKSGILKRLETLDLRSGCISDAGARTLAACPDLKRLQRLDLSRNELTEQGIAALRAVGIPLSVERQHTSTAEAEPYERRFLYEGDIE